MLVNTPAMYGYNLFAYCANNPTNLSDPSGYFGIWDIMDIAFAVHSFVEFSENPSWGNFGALALDTVSLFPVIPSAGYITKADDVLGVVSGMNKAEAAVDAVKYADTPMSPSEWLSQPNLDDYVIDIFGECFIAGTLVKTESGMVPIEQIEANELVWAWNEKTGEIGLKRVVQTFVNESDELIHVFINGEEIITTPTHPFYCPVKGWTSAAHLRAGDILILVNGEYVVVEKIQHEILEAPITVYNFEVEDFHTYYVGESSVLVHNVCSPTVPVDDLIPTHKLTKSKRAMNKFVEDIRMNGIQDPIKYTIFETTKYIVDGHHRAAAAKMLNIPNVPAIEVFLPYKGYRTFEDLFWWE